MGFEPTTVGFGVQRSTVGATPSELFVNQHQCRNTSLEEFLFYSNIVGFLVIFIYLNLYTYFIR